MNTTNTIISDLNLRPHGFNRHTHTIRTCSSSITKIVKNHDRTFAALVLLSLSLSPSLPSYFRPSCLLNQPMIVGRSQIAEVLYRLSLSLPLSHPLCGGF